MASKQSVPKKVVKPIAAAPQPKKSAPQPKTGGVKPPVVAVPPKPIKPAGGSLADRGNAVSLSEAVRAVQNPKGNSPAMRKYYYITITEKETVHAVENVKGKKNFLLAEQKTSQEDEDLLLAKKKRLHQIDSPPPIDYPDICTWLPAALRTSCDYNPAIFRNTLDLIARGGYIRGFPDAAAGLFYYFDGHGAPAFLNPYAIVANTAAEEEMRSGVGRGFWMQLIRQSIDPYSLFSGQSLDAALTQQSNYTTTQPLQSFPIRVYNDDFEFLIGTATINPLSGATATYTIDPEHRVIRMTMSANIELYDRYDWGGTPYYVNPTTGYVRFPSINGLPAVEFDPATNTVVSQISDAQVAEGDGFVFVPFPPDSPDLGNLARVIQGSDSHDNPVFGTPDHPNPIRGAVEQITNNTILGALRDPFTTGYYSGEFHQLEAENVAKPYMVFSEMQYTIGYDVPYVVSDTGQIIIQQYNWDSFPSPVMSQISSQYNLSSPLMPLSEIGYSPSIDLSDEGLNSEH